MIGGRQPLRGRKIGDRRVRVERPHAAYFRWSGKGVMTADDKAVDMVPGTAVLTRPGSSHSLKQVGPDDLVVLIAYEIK